MKVILEFIGEEVVLVSGDDLQSTITGDAFSVEEYGLAILGGNKSVVKDTLSKLGALDQGLPYLILGDVDPEEVSESSAAHGKVLSRIEWPPAYNKLLDSLYRAQVYREQFNARRERGQQREIQLFRSLVGTSRGIHQV
ncbi:MAG: sigma-54-dependent Fis family transcriptional regulator, partial [Pseudomonadales bacterium]|nr:sigma-54-dependent Fis family transcriptional regulator [Pseudomonadales bacterium]